MVMKHLRYDVHTNIISLKVTHISVSHQTTDIPLLSKCNVENHQLGKFMTIYSYRILSEVLDLYYTSPNID